MKQKQLTETFDTLLAGLPVEGWGMSQHRDFDTLVNSNRRLWVRQRGGTYWSEKMGIETHRLPIGTTEHA